jgi:GT2 family glycosyltransferase
VRFSLVIVSWNSAPELDQLLPTVERHLPGCPVVAVDNASTDSSVERLTSWTGGATVVQLDSNRGFGAANNVGVRRVSTEVVVLLNPDTRLVDSSLSGLAELARNTAALCGPRLLNDDGTPQPSASTIPGGWESMLRAFLPAGAMPEHLRVRCEPWRSDSRERVGWLTGACIAARRDVLLELGPFDERIEMYGEDLDVCLRAAARGIDRVFAPDVARVVHSGGRAASRRYGDAGLREKIATRNEVVRLRLGERRAVVDEATELVFHASRYGLKRLLGRRADGERAWLRGRSALRRRRGSSSSEA